MRQFRKGRRLVALCEQKSQNVQRTLVRLNGQRGKVLEQIIQCDDELRSLGEALISLHIQQACVTRADIFRQRKRQAVLLHQRQQVSLERVILHENLAEIDLDIRMNQQQLAILKRKEMKFSKWVEQDRKQWMMRQDSVNEDESQEVFPWAGQAKSDRN